MQTILSVAEKPSVAKSLAEIIGQGSAVSTRNGFSPYNKVFEVTTRFQGQPCKMVITSVLGHLMELKTDEAFNGSWASTNPIGLFDCQVTKTYKEDCQLLKKTLQQEIKRCDGLLLWLDCDLEGENIAFEVIQCCVESKPMIKHHIFRARFSALNNRDIQHALQHPDRPNAHMNNAVDARQEIDLRLGAAFTRFQTVRVQSKFPGVLKGYLSYGPCQFPTLGFVVERYLKITSFVPESFWYIALDIEAPSEDDESVNKSHSLTWERNRLFDRLSCIIIYEMCVNSGQGKVVDCSSRPTTKPRPCPLNTIELQKEASRNFRMPSDRTMEIAEKLYQGGLISYPRTETTVYKEGFELTPLVEEQTNNPSWGAYSRSLLNENAFEWPRNGGQDDQAHPPIHPLKSVPLESLDSEERKVYELVVRHFLASCSKDAKGQQSSVRVEVATLTGGELFKITGLMVIEKNWLVVYPWTKWTGSKIPSMKVGDYVAIKRMELMSGRTEPPPPLNEVDLISQMDKCRIGTVNLKLSLTHLKYYIRMLR